MKKIVLNLRGKTIREYSSYRQFFVNILDVLGKISIIVLFALSGLFHELISVKTSELSGYIILYVFSIFVWGLLFVKLIVGGKDALGKSRFDFFFMGLLSLSLISIVFTGEHTGGIFGSENTWSYSVITFLAAAILYYVTALIFRYPRGLKWLGVSFVLSLFVGGSYHVIQILSRNFSVSYYYIQYATFSIPLVISFIFIFKKLWVKSFSFIALLLNLFLIGYYANLLRSVLFTLSVSIFVLFLIFYFSFWIKNSYVVLNAVRNVFKTLKDKRRSFKKSLRDNSNELYLLSLIIFVAGIIISLGYYIYDFFRTNIGPYFIDWFSEDIGKINGVKMWLVGDNNLSEAFSSIEVLNILKNYGIVTTTLFLLLFIVGAYIALKLSVKYLHKGKFKSIFLFASIFITIFSLLLNLILSRYSSQTYLLLIFIYALLAIISDVIEKKDMAKLQDYKKGLSKTTMYTKIFLSILVFFITLVGIIGVLSGLERGFFV